MRVDLKREAESYKNGRRNRKRLRKAVAVLALAVVLCTTYALTRPAITMEQEEALPHTDTDACYETALDCPTEEIELPANDYLFENEAFSISLRVGDGERIQSETASAAPVLLVTELDEQSPEYRLFASGLKEEYRDGLMGLSVLSLELCSGDTLLNISDCGVTVQIKPQPRLLEEALEVCSAMAAEAAPEAEAGVVFSVIGETGELDSVLVDASTGEAPVLTAALDGGLLAVAAAQTANPKFTVQYYAYLDTAATTGTEADSLTVIDTNGGILPQNGTDPATKTLYLEETSSGSGVYGIKTEKTLSRVYSEHDYHYITAPNLTYFNRLYENGHYAIKEIWILKAGGDPTGTNQSDWNVYPSTTHFTNRSQSVNESTVLITDSTVIRLVFDTTTGPYTNAVNFYDYDITNDGVHTAAQGINSDSNYTGSGTHLAFGNVNTDTGLGAIYWGENQLNKYNSNGYSGCTFGLVTGLNGGNLQYASGVSAPKLFEDGTAKGKTAYNTGQYSLAFDRNGDTYTLSAVNGTGATGLRNFNHPVYGTTTYTHIWTNNFWPMDVVRNTDPHTGELGNVGTYIGASGTTKNYPPSDDGKAHNSMFGMSYMVQFTLTEDYVGPLEYYFFGDDDMWVFLDGTLVCDIGGVHSSVGEYVNLWDYVHQGSSGTHTLSFYYTERGLSGSTCYMQFTLPSVSSVTPEQNTGLLTVQKQVEGTSVCDEEFHFEIMFTDENGKPLPDDYSYTRYAKDGSVVKQDVIIYDGGSFELKDGEYVVINYLPYGTRYTVTETDCPRYTVSVQLDGGASAEGGTAEGQITKESNGTVVFTNTVRHILPNTGGSGTQAYTVGGVSLITAAVILLLYRVKKRGKEDIASS